MTALRRGTELGDEFVIEKVLGQGSFGITYAVRALKTINDEVREGDICVVKEYFPRDMATRDEDGLRLRPQPDKEEIFERFRASFAEEGRALARFFDPGIVRVFILRQAFETAYIVMEHIDGLPFDQYLLAYSEQRQRPMTARDLEPLAKKLLDALAQVHDAGLVHRDIKPGNIMIRRNGEPVLIDFGGARAAEKADQSVIHTPAFAPKEQIDGQNIGPWSDIYSLAATFYNALTGDFPRHQAGGQDRFVPLEHHPRRADFGIPLDFARAIDWALVFNEPSRRPQTVQAWRAHLFPGSAPGTHAGNIGVGDPRHHLGGVTGPRETGPTPAYDSREMNWDGQPAQKPRRLAMFGVVMGVVTALVAVAALVFVILNPLGAPDPVWRGSISANSIAWTRVVFVDRPPQGASIGFAADAPFRLRVDGNVYSFVDDHAAVGLPPLTPESVVEVKAVSESVDVRYYF